MAFRLLRGMTWLGVVAVAIGVFFLGSAMLGQTGTGVVRTGALFVLVGVANVVLARRYARRLRAHLAASGA